MNRLRFSSTCKRLVGGARDDQVIGQILLDGRELGIDASAKGIDLLAILHLHGQGYGAAAAPVALLVGPGEVVQIFRRALVAAGDIYQVAQVDRALRRRLGRADDHIADLLRIGEFSRRINQDALRADFELAAGKRDVARAQNVLQV